MHSGCMGCSSIKARVGRTKRSESGMETIFQDAMQIVLPFVTSDHRQLETAHGHGFKTMLVE